MLWGFGDGRLPPGGWLRWRAGLLAADFGQGFAPHPTLFLCLAKEIGERKATRDARPSVACGDGGPLRFSKTGAAPEWRVGYAAA